MVSIGATHHPAPWDMSVLDAYEMSIHKRMAILNYFIAYEENNPPEIDRLKALDARGTVPMITWEWKHLNDSEPLVQVANGKYDATIRLWASVLGSYGKPVLLRFFHEMNLASGYPWCVGVGGNTPKAFINAWRHVVTVMRQTAPNVRFVWSPNIQGGGVPSFEQMFPGASYMHWMGLDGYNGLGNPWKSFYDILAGSYTAITKLSALPLMLSEWGCQEGPQKPSWLVQALTSDIPLMFPRIKAAVYFNNVADSQNWPIESSPEAVAAYAAGVAYAMPVYSSTFSV